MSTRNLIFHRVTLFFILIAGVGFFQCEERKPDSDAFAEESTRFPDEEPILRYQLFNLELAAEEAYHIRNTTEANGARTAGTSSSIVALQELKGPCDFDCEPFDLECLLKYIDCKETTQTVHQSSLGDDDGDGSDPLPPASDTSIVAAVDLTEVVIFTDDPETSEFKLVTNEGDVYAMSDNSADLFRYDKEKRLAVYKIRERNPELASKPLIIYMSTMIVNAAGEKRVIELKRPFGLVFRK